MKFIFIIFYMDSDHFLYLTIFSHVMDLGLGNGVII